MVKCKKCGDEHPALLQIEERSFPDAFVPNRSEQCPKCRKPSTYSKADYFFRRVQA